MKQTVFSSYGSGETVESEITYKIYFKFGYWRLLHLA